MSMAFSFGNGRGSGPVSKTAVPPTVTEKTPFRGLSACWLIVTLTGASAFSSFVARVLNAPQLLHASMFTAPPPTLTGAAFFGELLFAMVFFGATFFAAAFLFGGIAGCCPSVLVVALAKPPVRAGPQGGSTHLSPRCGGCVAAPRPSRRRRTRQPAGRARPPGRQTDGEAREGARRMCGQE